MTYATHFGTGVYCTLHKVDWLFCLCSVLEIKSHFELRMLCREDCDEVVA